MFPRKGTLTLTPGMGVGGPSRIPQIQKQTQQSPKILKLRNKSFKTCCLLYMFSLEGSFDIDARDGGEQIPNILNIPAKTNKHTNVLFGLKTCLYYFINFLYSYISYVFIFLHIFIFLYIFCVSEVLKRGNLGSSEE